MDSHTFLISEEWTVTLFLLVMNHTFLFVRNGQSHFSFCDEWTVTLFLLVMNGQSHTFLFVMKGQSHLSY